MEISSGFYLSVWTYFPSHVFQSSCSVFQITARTLSGKDTDLGVGKRWFAGRVARVVLGDRLAALIPLLR